MISERTTVVVKNRSTEQDRAFWSHVESVATQSRNLRALSTRQPTGKPENSTAGSNDSNENSGRCSGPSENDR